MTQAFESFTPIPVTEAKQAYDPFQQYRCCPPPSRTESVFANKQTGSDSNSLAITDGGTNKQDAPPERMTPARIADSVAGGTLNPQTAGAAFARSFIDAAQAANANTPQESLAAGLTGMQRLAADVNRALGNRQPATDLRVAVVAGTMQPDGSITHHIVLHGANQNPAEMIRNRQQHPGRILQFALRPQANPDV